MCTLKGAQSYLQRYLHPHFGIPQTFPSIYSGAMPTLLHQQVLAILCPTATHIAAMVSGYKYSKASQWELTFETPREMIKIESAHA